MQRLIQSEELTLTQTRQLNNQQQQAHSLNQHHHHQNTDHQQHSNTDHHHHHSSNPLLRINFREEKQFLERHHSFYGKCRNVEEFEKLEKIFENIYKARDRKTNEIVALKRLDFSSKYEEGISLAYLREISYLQQFCQELKHGNILGLKEMVVGSKLDSVFIVMDFVENDLTTVIDKSKRFALLESEIKCIMLQILEGVNYLHENLIIHSAKQPLRRDLKPSNILYDRGIIKIIDFGLARNDTNFLQHLPTMPPIQDEKSSSSDSIIQMFRKKTPNLITLWYRPLELLLGTLDYDKSIDMWSVGCIFAEILLRRPLFGAETELEAFDMIFRLLGSPDEQWLRSGSFPSASKYLSNTNLLKKYEHVNGHENIQRTFSNDVDPKCIDLIEKLLSIDPKKRLTCKEALNHDYFKTYPLACSPKQLPSFMERDFISSSSSNKRYHHHHHQQQQHNYNYHGHHHDDMSRADENGDDRRRDFTHHSNYQYQQHHSRGGRNNDYYHHHKRSRNDLDHSNDDRPSFNDNLKKRK